MQFNEELLTDEGYRRLNGLQQHELIANNCRGIEERIKSSSSRREARHIVDAACSEIERTCHSALIRSVLKTNVEGMIARHWDGDSQAG